MGFIKKFQCQHCHGIVETEFDDDYVICGHCESACQVPKEFGPGVVIDDFVVAKLLGEGGMGNVYLAHQFSLDRKVALKILKDDFLKDPKFKEEFIYEARNVACLNHPNIIQAYKVGEEDGMVFFAMEYVEGRNLQDLLKEEGAITEKLALSVAMEIVSALGYGWDSRKLVHRDIKPENIMIASDGTAKLMDLGLSLRDGDDKDDGDTISGTPQYISPEQILGTEIDIRADFYCLGATLYHLVSGKLPFEGALPEIIKKHLSEKPKSIRKIAPHINSFFAKIIHKMMSKKPEDRFDDAKSLLSAFQKDMQIIIDEEHGKKHFKINTQTNIKTSTNSTELIQRKKKKDPLIIASLVMLGLLLGGFFMIRIFMSSGRSAPKKEIVKETSQKINGAGSHIESQTEVAKVEAIKPDYGLYYTYYRIKMDNKGKVVKSDLTKLGEADYFSELAPESRQNFYKIHYEGFITIPHSETYMFHLKADDSLTLYIDNKRVGKAGAGGRSFTRTFNKGTYPVKIEYVQHAGGKNMSIEVESISISKTRIPKTWFTKSGETDLKLDEAKKGLDYVLYNDVEFITSIANKNPDRSGETAGLKPFLDQEEGQYVACFSGLIKIPKAGRYRIYLNANTKAFLYLNDILIMDATFNDSEENVKEIHFPSEVNKIQLDYLQKRNDKKLILEIEGEGLSRQEVPAEWFYRYESENFIASQNKVKAAPVKESEAKASSAPKGPVVEKDDVNAVLNFNYYETTYKENVEDLLKEPVINSGTVKGLNHSRGKRDEHYGLYFYGYINIPETEEYTFYLRTDDQGLLKIDGKEIVRDTAAAGVGTAKVSLIKGSHKFEMLYYQATQSAYISLEIESKNIKKKSVPNSWYSIDPENNKLEKKIDNFTNITPTQESIDKTFEAGVRYTLHKPTESIKNLDAMLKGKIHIKDKECNNINIEAHSGKFEANFGLVYEGYLNFESDKTHVLGLISNDGSRLYIEDKLIIDNDGTHEAKIKKATLTLKRGIYKFRLEYFQEHKDKELILKMMNAGGKMVTIKANHFVRKKTQ